MADSGRPWQIYSIIAIGIIGIIAILWRLFSRRDGQTPSPTEQALPNNNIIESNSLPPSCQSFKSVMNCIIKDNKDSNRSESLIDYYRETLATWNVLPLEQLSTTCQQSLSYITKQVQGLSGTYQTCVSIIKKT